MALIKTLFKCNSLKVGSDHIFVKRGPFGDPGHPCGNAMVKYKKENWDYHQTGETCPDGKVLWEMRHKSHEDGASPSPVSPPPAIA